jgi:hypothetical protein
MSLAPVGPALRGPALDARFTAGFNGGCGKTTKTVPFYVRAFLLER